MSVPSLFGIETEYALSGKVELRALLPQLMDCARGNLVHLSGGGDDMFLANGARFYVDCGGHPEMTTPECTHPSEIVRYIRAGERTMERLAEQMGDDYGATVFRTNVDYSGSRSTWGCHESYLHRRSPEELPIHLIPHLVTRVVFSGAGGFDSYSPGIEFTLSPRTHHLKATISNTSTSRRAIFHTKDEPLATAGYHRMHLLCGESLGSDLSTWLKVGTTALVLALFDAGHEPGRGLELRYPLRAMRAIARDPSCRKRVSMADRSKLTALEIQRELLGRVEARIGDDAMPEWTAEVCRVWREVLDALATDPDAMSARLDWAIKYAIYRNHAERRGFDWSAVAFWTGIVSALDQALRAAGISMRAVPLDEIIGPACPVPAVLGELTTRLDEKGETWDRLEAFLALRQELFEIDTRFGQLSPQGIFATLDRDGVLDHHVPGVRPVEHATDHPPAVGRARIRGESVRKHAGRSGFHCTWQSITDLPNERVLDLSDPFTSKVEWRTLDF